MYKSIIKILKNATVQRIILIILTVLFFTLFLNQCNTTKKVEQKAKQNERALQNELIKTKDLLGNEVNQKAIFQTSLNELKLFNRELYDEVKKMKGEVLDLSKITASFKDTIPKLIKSSVSALKDTTNNVYKYTMEWEYSDSIGSLKQYLFGISKLNIDMKTMEARNHNVTLKERNFNLDLIVGHERRDGYINVFVKPKYPTPGLNLNATGAIIEDNAPIYNKKKWHIGPQFNIGVGGPINKFQLYSTFNWQVGIGLTYSILSF